MTCFVAANKLTTAANSIVLQFTAPMFIVVFSALFLKKRFSRADVLAVVLTMAGISLFFFDQLTPGHLAGNCVAIFAGMAFACYYMSLEGASESQRMSAILIAHGLTFLVGLPFTFVYPPELSAAPVACILVLGVVQLGIPSVLLGRASGACPRRRRTRRPSPGFSRSRRDTRSRSRRRSAATGSAWWRAPSPTPGRRPSAPPPVRRRR